MMKGSAQLTTCGVALSLNAVSLHNNIRKLKTMKLLHYLKKLKHIKVQLYSYILRQLEFFVAEKFQNYCDNYMKIISFQHAVLYSQF